MKQNITISIDKELLQKARVFATKKSISISQLLSEELPDIITRSENYERGRTRALAELKSGFHLGGRPVTREELHVR